MVLVKKTVKKRKKKENRTQKCERFNQLWAMNVNDRIEIVIWMRKKERKKRERKKVNTDKVSTIVCRKLI